MLQKTGNFPQVRGGYFHWKFTIGRMAGIMLATVCLFAALSVLAADESRADVTCGPVAPYDVLSIDPANGVCQINPIPASADRIYNLLAQSTSHIQFLTRGSVFNKTSSCTGAGCGSVSGSDVQCDISVSSCTISHSFDFQGETISYTLVAAMGSTTIAAFTISGGAFSPSTSSDAPQNIADFLTNRANNILNSQPDLSGFLDGPGNGGGPLGNLALNANDGQMNLAFSTSLSRIEREVDRRMATVLNATPDDTHRNARLLALNQAMTGERAQRRIELAYAGGTQGQSETGATLASLQTPANATDNSALSTSAYGEMPADRFDVWTQVSGATSRTGAAKSGLWVGYAGAHYFLTPNLIVGALVQFDWADETNNTAGSSADGFGWMAGPYMAGRITGTSLTWEARAAWGRSDNTISPVGTYRDDFSTTRWLASAKLAGAFPLGSATMRPTASVSYFEETQQSYTDSLSATIPEQTVSLGEIRFGPEFTWDLVQTDGAIIRPKLGVSGVWNFNISNNNASQGYPLGDGDLRARFDAGITVATALGWSFLVEGYYDGLGADNYQAWGGKARISVPLN